MAYVYRASQCAARLGLANSLDYLVRAKRKGRRFSVQLPGVPAAINLRSRSSDVGAFESVFFREAYPPPNHASRAILDLGANAGYASLFFALHCPHARILAVEPDPENFALLTKNACPYPNIICLQAAAWSNSATLHVVTGANYSDSITEPCPSSPAPGTTTVRAYSIDQLMEHAGFSWVDLIKMDVEGAEREIFLHGTDGWLSHVGALYVETHDRFAPGAACALVQALHGSRFNLELRGENLLIFFTQRG